MKNIIVTPGNYVEISTHELMFISNSGQPYRGVLGIQYITKSKAIEFISLKKYVESLRRTTCNLEDIAKLIYDNINEELDNNTLKVTVRTTPRGGFSTTVIHGDTSHAPIEIKPIVFGG